MLFWIVRLSKGIGKEDGRTISRTGRFAPVSCNVSLGEMQKWTHHAP